MNKEEKNSNQKIKGVLERIVFKNPESNYVVGRLREENKGELITIVGNVFEIQCGEKIEVVGKWIFNKKYGEQFEIKSISVLIPTTTAGIKKYLGSGLIKGIGPVMAEKIVSHFKLDTIKILDEEPEKLAGIDGFAKKRINIISKAWKKHKDAREVMIFLQSYGISNTYAVKIYNNYGKNSTNVIKVNPYRLSEDISGIGFRTADRIAGNVGIKKDSVFRIKSGVIHLLHEAEDRGHCYYPYEQFVEIASEFLEVGLAKVLDAIKKLEKENKICIVQNGTGKVYLKDIYDAEKYVCEKLLQIIDNNKNTMKENNKDKVEDIYKKIKMFSDKDNISLDNIQIEAIKKAVTEKVLVITGSPGTGKSTILNFVIKILESENRRVAIAAPTGRASKRLSETTGREAKTIHRLLGYNPKLNKFLKNEDNPISEDIVVIDEASMIDIKLLKNLLKAVKKEASIILVGDVDQLPSVGPGNVLADIIDSNMFAVVRLEKIYRQDGKSLIIHNAHKVRDGHFPYIGKPKYNDFYFIEKVEPEDVVSLILYLITKRIPESFNYDPLLDIQVLVPTNKGVVGVNNLNSRIQNSLNISNLKVLSGATEYRLNDKVIQLKNNYEKDIYNGDIGFIRNIDMEKKEIKINFEEKIVSYNFCELDEISLSYAISIHKSQGSEFRCVVVPILTSHYMLLQRNLLYTAITRAKELAVLVGSKKAIGMAVNRNIVENRNTGLKELLKNYYIN